MKKTKRIVALSLVLVLLLSLSAVAMADTYYVCVRTAKVFSAKNNTLDPIATLKGPAKVEVTEVDGDWASVMIYHWAMVDGEATLVGTPGYMLAKELTDSMPDTGGSSFSFINYWLDLILSDGWGGA